jgi:hypothetical protein
VRAGENSAYRLVVDVSPFGSDPVTLEIRNTSWALVVNPTPGQRTDADFILASTGSSEFGTRVSWTFDLPVGISYVLVKRFCRIVDDQGTLYGWALDHARGGAGSSNGIVLDGTTAQGSPYGALASYAPANVLEFYDEEVAVDGPLSAWVTSRLNRKINALWEYVTGGSLPGNVARQISNTWDSNRTTWTSEALLEFPIACVAVGASSDIASPKAPASSSMPGWIRYPDKHNATAQSFCGTVLQLPNFRTSTSDLRVEVLMEAPANDTLVDWRFDAIVAGLAASAVVAPTQMGGSRWWRAQITGVPFNGGATNQLDVRISYPGGGVLSKLIQLTGVCVYFDP